LYYALDGKQNLSEALAHKEIIEYPSILVISSSESSKYPLKKDKKEEEETPKEEKQVIAKELLEKFLES
jgi:hypothetical protein